MNKLEMKNNVKLFATALAFMLFSYLLYNLFYTSQETAFYSKIYTLDKNIPDSINANIEYSKLKAELNIDTLISYDIHSIKITPKIKINNPNTEIQLVFSVEYKGKTVFWEAHKLQNQVKEINTWQKLEVIQNIENFNFIKEHKIKIYFWNNSKSNFLVHNIFVEMLERKQEKTNVIFNE